MASACFPVGNLKCDDKNLDFFQKKWPTDRKTLDILSDIPIALLLGSQFL